MSQSRRPQAPGAYSTGNNPAARGVPSRRASRDHDEDRLEPSELERFEAIVLPHLDAAYTLARYLTRNDHDAEDVVQEACLRALKYFGGYRGTEGDSGRAWVLAIVRNTAYSSRRRQRPDAVVLEFDEAQHSGAV